MPAFECPESVQVHPTRAEVLIGLGHDVQALGSRPSLKRSLDGGKTWISIAPSFADQGQQWRASFVSGETTIAWNLATQEAHRSSDTGTTWQPFVMPAMGPVARDYSAPGALFVESGGLWRFAD